MPSGFVHSVKVPRLYKSAAKIVQEVREKGGSLKSLIYEQKHPNVSAIYSLSVNTLQKEALLNHLLTRTGILLSEPRLDPWLARILINELLWGKESLKTECKPAKTILSYEKQLRDELRNARDVEALQPSSKAVRKPRYVRVNTLLLPLHKAVTCFQDEGWSLLPKCATYASHLMAVKSLSQPKFIQDFHVPELLVFPPDTTFHNHAAYQNGEIILQDKASCLPTQLLNPEPGSEVLDMCAAPGMKSSHLAAIMRNEGKVFSIEIDKRRYGTLCEQVKLTSSSCIETINTDALTLDANEYSNVTYILVDPTCSGSGKIRQLVFGKEQCSPQRLKQLQAFQALLLKHALLNFPNVKKVVYSTCSIYPEENEQVIDEVLEMVQDAYTLVPAQKLLKDNWTNYSSKNYKCSDKCLYAKSDLDLCTGFFVAVFERNLGVPLPEYKRKGRVASDEQQLEGNDESNTARASSTRTKKKRGKRKSTNAQEDSIVDSSLNVSSDSIKIIGEMSSQNDDDEEVASPVKKAKKKAGRRVKRQPDEGARPTTSRKRFKMQKEAQ
ncbi:nop2/Sun-like domain containing protein 5 isoform X2 [Andrena cerasifolii]|uniref:nop2/Sun-like domain containing protein 5 isoform X2 n=1 Tax=Andrena cerasifolii TaxID=2819439 RepID=UPI0040379C7C